MRLAQAVGLLVPWLVACSAQKSTPTDAGTPLVAPSTTSAVSIPDAGPPSTTVVDLLHWGPARLAVSSNVKNPRDYPEHLVDGNEGTAWNSRTGDLVGATIAFEVPADSKIQTLVLSAGFHKTNAKGEDLFAMNHRIRSVTVHAGSLEDPPLLTLTLDPNRREPQAFPFEQPGGLYWLKVAAVQPGTQKAWKELAISELRVMGLPGAGAYGLPRIPDVSIAKEWVDRPLPGTNAPNVFSYQTLLGALHPTLSALCADIESKIAGEIAANGYTPDKPWCVAKPVTVPLPAPLKSIAWVDLVVPEGSAGTYVLETDRGFVIPKNAELQSAPCPAGCMDDTLRVDTQLEKVEYAEGNVTLSVKQASSSSEAFDDRGVRTAATDTHWFTLRCALASAPITCARTETKAECNKGGKAVRCR